MITNMRHRVLKSYAIKILGSLHSELSFNLIQISHLIFSMSTLFSRQSTLTNFLIKTK